MFRKSFCCGGLQIKSKSRDSEQVQKILSEKAGSSFQLRASRGSSEVWSLSLPVRREDVEGRRLLARLEGLLQRDGQRLALKQLLVLDGGAPEGLPHGDVLERH